MRSAFSWVPGAVLALVVISVVGPGAVGVLRDLVAPVIGVAIAVIAVRLVWFWTSL